MACMWPKKLPDWVLSDPRRRAEINVFRKLEHLLDSEWSVFYSRPWWGISEKGGEIDGESDFIVAHPEHGLLFLEVKGGGITYDPSTEQWSSRDSHGVRHKVKDPVKQAMTCKHKFLNRLKKINGWPNFFVRFRHGVIFPDSGNPSADKLGIGPYEKDIFCCAQEFDLSFDKFVFNRLLSHKPEASTKEYGPGAKGIEILHKIVADPVSLKFLLSREMHGELLAMDILLTGMQLTLLHIVDESPRALIEGGAGTGKTLLAQEMSVRCATSGLSVLFCCRSGPLAGIVSSRLSEFKNITVLQFEELFDGYNASNLGRLGLPQEYQWDVVIVDEGQDFDWEWWDFIDKIIKTETGKLRVFADSNQAVYRLRDDLETRLNARSFPLRINLRNTKSIAKATERLYKGPLIEAPGPEGKIPHIEILNADNASDRAVETVKNLILSEGVNQSAISVLVPTIEIREIILSKLKIFRIHSCNASQRLNSAVTVDTVARFKGLESTVVIMVINRELANNQELSYVGVSRARSRLIILGPIRGTLLDTAVSPKN